MTGEPRSCPVCGAPCEGRRRYCSNDHAVLDRKQRAFDALVDSRERKKPHPDGPLFDHAKKAGAL